MAPHQTESHLWVLSLALLWQIYSCRCILRSKKKEFDDGATHDRQTRLWRGTVESFFSVPLR